MLQYREHQVGATLSNIVKKLWVLDNSTNPIKVEGKSVLPNGCFNVAIVNGEGASVTTSKSRYALVQGVYFCGQMTKAVLVDINPHTKVSIIQLHPWAPSLFMAEDMSRFKNDIVELDALNQTVEEARSDNLFLDEPSLLCLLQNVAAEHAQNVREDVLVKESCSLILQASGNMTVQDLIGEVGVSERLLQKRFKQAVGLSPKEYLKIIKLRDAVDQIAYPKDELPTGTTVAVNSDYYDQAHFIHSFKDIVNTTPKKFKPVNYLLSLKEK